MRPLAADIGPRLARQIGSAGLREAESLIEHGLVTREQVLAAIRRIDELGDATERGELTVGQGMELMEKLAYQQAGRSKAD